jgi:tetratricopeptide (TPR) repeat protein
MEKLLERRGERRARARRHGGLRRWCLPPAVSYDAGEMLEAACVLEELEGDTAVVLWTAARDVTLWATTPPARRAGLFAAEAASARREGIVAARLEPALVLSLALLSGVVSPSGQANPATVQRACMEVARWAQARGAPGTAVTFTQAGALASPRAPCAALEVGRLALEWGRWTRAEAWLRRAIALARRAADWESYGAACVALGEVYERTGRMKDARRAYEQAARLARRKGVELRGEALHGLLRCSLAAGDLDAAEAHALAARRAYGPRHPRLPELQRDVARLRGARERSL